MRFVNRVAERSRLDGVLASDGGGLAVLWGRRRVGKTRLLLEWSRDVGGLYVVADQSAQQVQRRYFAEAAAGRFEGFADVEYRDWRSLLVALAREAARAPWRGPLIVDEFPYLMSSCPELPSVVQAWLDHEARAAGLTVVLSGSSQSMMQGLTLSASAPLYGRAVAAFPVQPMHAVSLREALGLPTATAAVEAFAVWGGIPRYWELAQAFSGNLDAAVNALLLDPFGPLHQEADRLLADELPPAVALRPVLDVVGAGVHRLSEIAARLGQPATSLSRPLQRLQQLGLLRRETPFGEPEGGGKRALYTIADPFSRLWFRVVASHRGVLAALPPEGRLAIWRTHRPGLVATAWEDACREAVPRLAGALVGHEGGLGPAGRWWRGNGPKLDVVARAREADELLLGEVRWHNRPATLADLEDAYHGLVRKGMPDLGPGLPARVRYAVFVPSVSPRVQIRRLPFAVIDSEAVLAAQAGG